MKYLFLTIIASLLCYAPLYSQTQSSASTSSIVEEITEGSNGDITIDIPEDILKELLEETATRQTNQARRGGSSNQGYTKREAVTNKGFRIQIFSDGRNQATLRSRANARANAVCARFPKYRGQVYTFSKSPNWYSRVGNFKTREEANKALGELRRAFPAFASEMRIVQSTIIPK